MPGNINQRDLPAIQGTSALSPHLHFGEISPHQIITELARSFNLLTVNRLMPQKHFYAG